MEKKVAFLLLSITLFLDVSCAKNPDVSFKELVSRGDAHFEKRQYRHSLVLWNRALEIQPASMIVLKKVAESYLQLGELIKAEEAFIKILQIQPNEDRELFELIRLQLILGKFDEARIKYEILKTRHPEDERIKILHGDILSLENRYEEAESYYKSAIGLSSKNMLAHIKLANCYMAQEKVKEAKWVFENAINNMAVDSVDAALQIANYWKMNDKMEMAEAGIRRAIQLETENVSLKMVLAKFLYNANRYDEARDIIESLIKEYPDNRSAKKYLIEILFAQNQMENIPGLLVNLQSERTDDLELDFIAGKYFLQIQNSVLSASYFKKVIKNEPENYLAHYMLGLSYLMGQHVYLSEQSLIKSLSLNPDFSEAEVALADIYYQKREFDISREHLKQVIVKQPENFRAHQIMGNISLAEKKYKEAIRWFWSALSLNPDSESAIYYIAVVNEYLGEKDKALKIYQELLEKNQNLADVAWRFKQLLVQNGKIEYAKKFFESNFEGSACNGYQYYIMGELYLAAEEKNKAVKCFNKAAMFFPSLPHTYIKLVEIYEKDNNIEKQTEILENCFENVPNFEDCYIRLSELYLYQGLTDRAMKTLEFALSNNPKSPLIANNLAFLYLEHDQDVNKAFELAQLSYEYMPKNPAVIDSLGWSYYKKGLFGQSIWYLKEACKLSPENPIIHYHLGMAQFYAGKKGESLDSLQHAISLNLHQPYLEKAETLFKELLGSNLEY